MKYQVYLLPAAERDLDHILTFLQERSVQGATNWLNAFEEALAELVSNPLRYSTAPENNAFEIELRQILFGTKQGHRYRMVYRIDEERVTVYRLRGKGQAPLNKDDLS